MRMKGLEPSLLSELEPKSSASANSATSALVSNTITTTFPWQEGSAIFFSFRSKFLWPPGVDDV